MKSIKYILGISAVLALGSCDKKLDLYPYSSIEITQSFKTMADAKAWDNAFYSALRGRVYGSYAIGQDVQADYLNASLDYGNRNGNPHRWGTSFLASDGLLSGVWLGYYSALKDINLCIEKLPTIPTTTTAEADQLKRYIGDAYLARAYYYSELVVRFADAYTPASASTDLGVPLVLTYDINAMPARATMAEVYTQIQADIDLAKANITAAGAAGANLFNKDVITALEARVKLNKQDWQGALTAANTLVTAATYPLITSQATLQNMWTNDFGQETIFQVFVSRPNELSNANSIYWGYNPANGKYTPDFIPTQSIINLYDNADIRKGVYFRTLPVIVQGVDYTNIALVSKYPGNPSLYVGNTNYAQAPKIFRVAEQYLIAAEAAAQLGGANEATALTRLNALRTARGLTALTGLTGTPLMTAIQEERTRELAFEGFRLWDLKRWHLGFTRGTPQNLGPIQQGANFNLLTIAADDDKFTWGIPQNDATINPNIVQNSGW
ncbi:MAG: RagB/SusD family nutrient uptake outer membrane protein [Ferruginibacter sp.]